MSFPLLGFDIFNIGGNDVSKMDILKKLFNLNSSFKGMILLLSYLILYTIFSQYLNKFDPSGMSLLITSVFVIIYLWFKILLFDNVNKKRETIYLVIFLILFMLSAYITFF
ncbi:hypothetical protein CIL05_20245 [Virgibacillus profundi]|uniref:Uncharacterized protein n=1 Tax=Virgibacillus profundi TaxID=2024555 RepID=A0A2A2I7W6_9BACI|nr:hypothetical protein CIL05_20245 [Virgibacillus profundi]PXY51902.1 hypothetical protein CIT14_20465 [Virgibacillus profundi]